VKKQNKKNLLEVSLKRLKNKNDKILNIKKFEKELKNESFNLSRKNTTIW